jgi:hypothetical protein
MSIHWFKKTKNEKRNEKPSKISIQQRWIYGALAFAGGIGACGIYYFFHETLLAFVFFGSTIFLLYVAVSKNKNKSAEQEEKLEEEFVRLFTYFSIYVQDGLPIYSALQELTKFASPTMKERLKDLLNDIDHDKSVKPYISFAALFPSLSVKEVMISVYKMVDEGASETYLRQYAAIFDSLAEDKRTKEKERHKRSLGNLAFLPLLASGLTSALITIGIMTVIGGLTSHGI